MRDHRIDEVLEAMNPMPPAQLDQLETNLTQRSILDDVMAETSRRSFFGRLAELVDVEIQFARRAIFVGVVASAVLVVAAVATSQLRPQAIDPAAGGDSAALPTPAIDVQTPDTGQDPSATAVDETTKTPTELSGTDTTDDEPCTAEGDTLDDAKTAYSEKCSQPRVDCDPLGDGWTCSSEQIGDKLPEP